MKRDEERAQTYLLSLAPKELRFEPNRKSTAPDFELYLESDVRIGVEVRRLNLNRNDDHSSSGLEEHNIPLMQKMKSLACEMQAPSPHRWYLCYSFERTTAFPRGPLSQWFAIEKYAQLCWGKLKQGYMEPFPIFGADYDAEAPETIRTLEFLRTGETDKGLIQLGSVQDLNTSGWCSQLLVGNVNGCLRDKTPKRGRWAAGFAECWLLLVDYVGHGIPEDIAVGHDWKRVIVINPDGPLTAYDL